MEKRGGHCIHQEVVVREGCPFDKRRLYLSH
jgi:hypothetical protein